MDEFKRFALVEERDVQGAGERSITVDEGGEGDSLILRTAAGAEADLSVGERGSRLDVGAQTRAAETGEEATDGRD